MKVSGRAAERRRKAEEETRNRRAQKKRALARFVCLRSQRGNTWAIFHVICGGRMTGKSYSVAQMICSEKEKRGENVKIYWMRISPTSCKALLARDAEELIDPDLQRKYKLRLTTKGNVVYNNGKKFCGVYPLASFGKDKGVAHFDKDFKGKYILILDEFQLEIGEKRTSFDILYNFIGMCENFCRTRKHGVEVWLLGNTLEEASTILKAFNFLPEKFGRFYLRSKRCVIDNLEPTEEYLADRKGSIADILGGGEMSNYTNELTKDRQLLFKGRTVKPTGIVKFSTSKQDWYTLWDGAVLKRYKNESLPKEADFCMRPYIDTYYSLERRQAIIDLYDARALKFDSLITQAYFTDALKMVRTR